MPPRRELVIPDTKKIVKAAFLDGKKPHGAARRARELLADWVTAPDNPYFARAAVNRVWARFFGTGIVDPVDDLDGDRRHPELLDLLAGQFRSHGYDLKFLIRAITATKAYGLTSVVGRSESRRPCSPRCRSAPSRRASSSRPSPRRPGAERGRCARPRFVELFTNRDEKPTEGETTILQALA